MGWILSKIRVVGIGVVIAGGISACQRVDQERVSEQVLQELSDQLFLEEAVELAEKYGDRAKAKAYFADRNDKFAFYGSEQQGVMTVDGYHLRRPSPVIGVSLFFGGEQATLVMMNITVHPSAEQRALDLINRSLDSVDAPGRAPSREAKLYFLGLYPLGPSKVMKIMVREDVLSSGAVYSINYAISATLTDQSRGRNPLMLDILLFVVGWALGFFIFGFIILPLFYGLPKAIIWVAKGQLRKGAIWYYIRTFVLSNIFLLIIVSLVSYLFPSFQDMLYNSGGFYYGQWVGIGLTLIYALTRKGRSDLDADFWGKMQSKYPLGDSEHSTKAE